MNERSEVCIGIRAPTSRATLAVCAERQLCVPGRRPMCARSRVRQSPLLGLSKVLGTALQVRLPSLMLIMACFLTEICINNHILILTFLLFKMLNFAHYNPMSYPGQHIGFMPILQMRLLRAPSHTAAVLTSLANF